MMFGLAMAMMELLKVHLVYSYLALAIGMPSNFPAFSFLFLAAFILNKALSTRRMRIMSIWLANAITFTLFFFLLYDSKNFIASSIAILAFYGRAWWLAASNVDHEFCVTRFDEGIGIYLVTLTIAALVKFENPFPLSSALAFFAFSILSLGLAQGKKSLANARFSKSHNATLASSILAMTLSAIGISGIVPLAFLPAKKAGTILGSLSLGLLAIITDILEWLFRARKPTPASSFSSGNDGIVYAERVGEEVGTSTIFMWVLMGIVGISLVILAGYGLAHLIRYLLSETGPRTARKRLNLRLILANILRRIGLFAAAAARAVRKALYWIAQRNNKTSPALRAYRKLLDCGKLSGLPRKKNETPREYTARLVAAYPLSAGSGLQIVDVVEREIYGMKLQDPSSLQQIDTASSSLRRRKFLAEKIGKLRTAASMGLKKT